MRRRHAAAMRSGLRTGGSSPASSILRGDDDLFGHLYARAVRDQGPGVGTALLRAREARASARVPLWTFQRNDGARRFYERHGLRSSPSPTAPETRRACRTCSTSGALRCRRRADGARTCGHDEPLDLARALVDLGDLRVAVVALDGELLGVAVAAQDLNRLGGLARAPSRTRTASPSRPPPCAVGPAA